MRIWLTCFGVLFAIAQLYQWVKHLTLPFPVYIVGGAFLAIASNYNKLAGWPSREPNAGSEPVISSANNPPIGDNPAPHLPPKSISFTISHSTGPQERGGS